MSWIKAPSSKVLHIRNWRRHHQSTVPALCSTRLGAYGWVSERVEGERVCAHCAREARREALSLLAAADGRVIEDPTVRRRSS